MPRPKSLLAVLLFVIAATTGFVARPAVGESTGASTGNAPRFGHVWIFVFENTNYDAVSAQSMPYLTAKAATGVTLSKMYGAGHLSLTNYIAMASGHTPNAKTKADCVAYDCVYERGDDNNIGDQLEAANLTWKAYMDGAEVPCPKPPKEGAADPNMVGYATRHNPFMYYRSIVGDSDRCAEHVRPFGDLASDREAGKVANYNFISPDTCNDAHDDSREQCQLDDADRWLQQQLDPILASDEYRHDGAVFLTFDEAEISDPSSCCGGTDGGGHIATAVLSPNLVKPGTVDDTPYSHYSLLRTVEDNFGLVPLRNAADPSTESMIDLFQSTPTTTTSAGASVSQGSTPSTQKRRDDAGGSSVGLWIGGAVIVVAAAGLLAAKLRSNKTGTVE